MFYLINEDANEVISSNFYDKVALVAHNCYQVKEKDHLSNVAFIKRLIDNKHLAMIEHYHFTYQIDKELYDQFILLNNRFYDLYSSSNVYLIGFSLRPLLEAINNEDKKEIALITPLINSLPEEIKELFPIMEKSKTYSPYVVLKDDKDGYEKLTYVTYHIITDRGVTHELVRHRLCSFAQESTRYCNYTKDKFSSALTFMKPLRYDEFKEVYDNYYENVVSTYFSLINSGCKPDEARSVLPNSLKASIMVTCSIKEWKSIFELRCSQFAHPDINRVMSKVKEDMEKKNYL